MTIFFFLDTEPPGGAGNVLFAIPTALFIWAIKSFAACNAGLIVGATVGVLVGSGVAVGVFVGSGVAVGVGVGVGVGTIEPNIYMALLIASCRVETNDKDRRFFWYS